MHDCREFGDWLWFVCVIVCELHVCCLFVVCLSLFVVCLLGYSLFACCLIVGCLLLFFFDGVLFVCCFPLVGLSFDCCLIIV